MSESILTSIKKMLGIDSSFTAFDADLILHINTVLFIIRQLGKDGNFSITGSTETWSDYLGTAENLEAIKTYIYCRVRKIFDPPTSSALMQALDETINELEWRIGIEVDPPEVT